MSGLWKLLVGHPNDSIPPLNYSSLTSIVRFSSDHTTSKNDQKKSMLTKIIVKAYEARQTAILKDKLVSTWLIDRLRAGFGWECDIRSLNADISTDLQHIEEFGEDMITETTFMIALLECFAVTDLASRTRLIHMMNKCHMQLPLTAKIEHHPSCFLTYVGCLNYVKHSFRNLVLCFGTDQMVKRGKDELIKNIFPKIILQSQTDPIRETAIELISYHDSESKLSLQIINVNGSFKSQIEQIRVLAPYCSALVFSMKMDDITNEGSLHIDDEQNEVLRLYYRKMIFVLRDVDRKMVKSQKVQEFWRLNNIPSEKQYFLDNFMHPKHPFFMTIQDRIRQDILSLVQGLDSRPLKMDPLEIHLKFLEVQNSSPTSTQTVEAWREIRKFVTDMKALLNSDDNIKEKNFQYSAIAEKFKDLNENMSNNHKMTINTITDLTSGRDPVEEYVKIINQKPSPIIDYFLNKVNTTTRIYFLEQEIQTWKMDGEVYQLRREIAEIQINRGKPNDNLNTSSQVLPNLIKRLDSIEWGVLDIWREIRIVRNLILSHTSVSSDQKRILSNNYPALVEKSDSLKSITGRFVTLFFSGFTVDAIDGTLLEYDHKFMEDAYRGNIVRELQGRNEQSFFVISVLGTQSTGKSTLLNNLFGCDLPVSAGRTTRGENVTCVNIDIPGCSVKNIVVQDFEGLMTMERGGSVFDKSICIYAMATSDLVLLNTSRVIDAPTQELLKYVMFAFHHLGLQSYRKPKMTFILRDMVSSDLTEFTSATKQLEAAMTEYFKTTSSSIQLEDILDQIHYKALASALHRQHNVWQETFTNLREHIFDNVRQFANDIPKDHQNWMAWINACHSIWSCVRKNLNLLDAGTLAEMHFKEQMDKYLTEAIDAPDTIQRSKQVIFDELDQQFESVNEQTDFDELFRRISDKISVEFKQCEEIIVKHFVEKVGVVQNSLTPAYETYKTSILSNVVALSRDDTLLIIRRRLEDARQKSCVDLCLQRLVRKIRDEVNRGLSQNDSERNEDFERLWEIEEVFLKQCTDNLYQEKNVLEKIHECYRVITINNHRKQPNNFNQLVNSKSVDILNIPLEQCIIIPEPGAWERLKNFFRRDPKNLRAEDYVVIVCNDIEKFITDMIQNETSGFSKLNGTIRDWVRRLNEFLSFANEDMIYDTKRSLSIDFFKASHRRLYLKTCQYYQYEAAQEQIRVQSMLTKHKQTLKENYLSAVTNTFDDVRTAEMLINSLQQAILEFAISESRLNISIDRIDNIVANYYGQISTPEALDKLCYRKTFLDRDTEKTFNFIIDRRRFLSDTWEEYYKQYTPILCNKKIDLALSGLYVSASGSDPPLFDTMQTAVNIWFEEKKNNKTASNEKATIDELLDYLRQNNELNKFLSFSSLLLVQGLKFQDVSFVHTILQENWSLEKQKQKVRETVKKLVEDLKDEIRSRSYGCDELCPYCSTKCSQKSDHPGYHYCHAHLISGFGRSRIRDSRKIVGIYCTGDAWDSTCRWYTPGNDKSDETFTTAEHLKKFYPNWSIQQGSSKYPPSEQRFMFRTLNHRICEKFGLEPNIPSDWPKD